jgi:predicted MPP superfamily phosphohydrolase
MHNNKPYFIPLTMAKIQYCSDLHLEFSENMAFLEKNPIEPVGDILILAGDIVPFALMHKYDVFFDGLSEKFEQVYWIPGNHEYYYSDIQQRTGSFFEEIRKNLFLVNNYIASIQNTKFLFSTLWTNLSEINQWIIQQRLSDFHVIKNGNDRFVPSDYNRLFSESFAFLKNAVTQINNNEPVVVVTHHVPTFLNYPAKYKGDALNEAFAVELYDFIESNSISYWIFGHCHNNTPTSKIGKTQLLTNQLGYVEYEENSGYSSSRYISI